MDIFDHIGEDILRLLYGYTAVRSCTGTAGEDGGAGFFLSAMGKIPYFQAHPEHLIRYPVPGDPLGRAVCCAMLRGTSPDTVVMLHHYDVTDTEDYGRLAGLAYDPEALARALREEALEPEARQDLEGGDFLFGHGVCDMKGGGAIQMALLSRLPADIPGTLMVLGVPDEENLSAGMRAAVTLLRELKERHGLRYRLAINSEPHQRRTPERGVFSVGSTGKLLPFVYAKGRMSHAGKSREGFNPFAVFSRVVARTEGLPFTADGAPPPTWLMARDDKRRYDVSMPRSAFGCLSVLTFSATGEQVLEKLRAVCEASFADCLAERERAFGPLPWRGEVYSWTQLRQAAGEAGGPAWRESLEELLSALRGGAARGELSYPEANRRLLDFACDALPDTPKVVYGLLPPYYPAVTNANLPGAEGLPEYLTGYARKAFAQEYETEAFYTGISDLSYTSAAGLRGEPSFIREMPLYGQGYSLCFEDLSAIAMPCVNIGPWGKDFHKLSERVCLSDLTEKTPRLLYQAIAYTLGLPR